jgi:hypothetical protein
VCYGLIGLRRSVGATVFGLGDVVSLGRDTGPTPDLVAVFLSLMLASPSQVNLEKATACRFANHSLVTEFLASVCFLRRGAHCCCACG